MLLMRHSYTCAALLSLFLDSQARRLRLIHYSTSKPDHREQMLVLQAGSSHTNQIPRTPTYTESSGGFVENPLFHVLHLLGR